MITYPDNRVLVIEFDPDLRSNPGLGDVDGYPVLVVRVVDVLRIAAPGLIEGLDRRLRPGERTDIPYPDRRVLRLTWDVPTVTDAALSTLLDKTPAQA